MNKWIILLVGAALGCNTVQKSAKKAVQSQDIQKTTVLSKTEGAQLLKTHCYACHNPASVSHDAVLAPPLAAVKFRYKSLFAEREAFVAKMSNFLVEPTKEKAIMPGPVDRFGVMLPTALSREEIIQISAFIYDEAVEVPSWFREHFEQQHKQKYGQ